MFETFAREACKSELPTIWEKKSLLTQTIVDAMYEAGGEKKK